MRNRQNIGTTFIILAFTLATLAPFALAEDEEARIRFFTEPSNAFNDDDDKPKEEKEKPPVDELDSISFPFFTTPETRAREAEAEAQKQEAERVATQAPGVAKLEESLRRHPSIISATQEVCEAQYNVLLGKSGYYPRLDMSLSGGEKLVDDTTRVNASGASTNSPEYDGDGINATLTLRQPIYDWGRTSSTIRGAQEQRGVAVLNRTIRMEEQLAEYFRMAFQYVLQTQLIAHIDEAIVEVNAGVDAMEARFKAGAARLAEFRQAKIYQLETETLLQQATRDRDAVVRAMDTTFDLQPADAELVVRAFLAARPDIPEKITASETFEARLLRRNIARAKAEHRRLQAERLPAFSGVVTARMWDVQDFEDRCQVTTATPASSLRDCSTHEVTGTIEFNLPLFDGGANAAQRGGLNAQRRSLEAELDAAARRHDAESRRLQDRLLGQLEQIQQGTERVTTLSEQLESQQLVQERTRSDPLSVMSTQQTLANAQAQQLGQVMQAELTRMEMLFRAGRLSETLKINIGASGC